MLWHPKTVQHLAMYNVFFIFGRFFPCRKATKLTQNSVSIPSWAQTPKNPRKMSKTQPNSGLGAKPFLGSGLSVRNRFWGISTPCFYAFVARKPVQNIMFDNASNSLISPTVENTAIYSVFSSIFPCSNAGSQVQPYIYIRNPCKTLCLTVFFQCFQSNRR